MKTSVFYRLPKEELIKIINESHSVSEVFRRIGMQRSGAQYKHFKRIVAERGIALDHFKGDYRNPDHFKLTIPSDQVFVVGSRQSSSELKRRIMRDQLKPYKCVKCDNIGEWQGEKLSLQLDHINGIPNDNRLENLRFLCPNCHTQTPTYCGKKLKKTYKCSRCDKTYPGYGKVCNICNTEINPLLKVKIKYPEKEELMQLVWQKPAEQLAKDLQCSGKGLKKHCDKIGVIVPPRSYWVRRRHGYTHEEALASKRIKGPPEPRRLNTEQAIEVIALLKQGEMSLRQISELYGVSRHVIDDIKWNRSYKEIPRM